MYCYGFNGKENDNEVSGSGNQYDYGFRIYDPRVGRFLSFDPLQTKFPYFTPYQYAGNRPIEAIDLDGLEPVSSNDMLIRQNAGITKWNQNVESVYEPAKKQWFSVMNYPNSNTQYYWKNKDGSDGIYPGDKAAGGGGYWQRYLTFEQQFKIQVDKDINAIGVGAVAVFVAPFAYAFAAEGAAVGWGVISEKAMYAATSGVLAYFRYAPAAGALGTKVADILDESGAVGMQASASSIVFRNASLKHIFTEAHGLLDNAANRKLLLDVANDAENLLGPDKYGNQWFSKINEEGKQIWAQVRNGEIFNGGLNNSPVEFIEGEGLKINAPQ